MDELLREFWAAWKRWERIHRDETASYTSPYGKVAGARAWLDLERLAARIELAELVTKRDGVPRHADVPGQMLMGEIIESKKGRAA